MGEGMMKRRKALLEGDSEKEEKEENVVLSLKYRPRTLDEVIGNDDVVEVLKSQLETKKVPHSILFHGPTGCGKTTLARILANELGAKGGDIKEIDTADFRGIETIRDIRKQAFYSPLEGKCRVWILDECHRLTGDAQSALLKILEDTPSHVYFFLCTTDPQKLLPTIRGRCAQYQVRTLTDKEMKRLLRKVTTLEDEELTQEVYEQIIQDSMGHPRNALQILTKVLSAPKSKRLEVAKHSAELESKVIELCRVLTSDRGNWKKASEILKALKDNEDPEQIRRAVLGYFQSILLNKDNPRIAAKMENFLEPFFNTGFPGLVYACYSCFYEG